jgi:hypothetical protein
VIRRELEAPCHACGAPTGADRALCAACAASCAAARTAADGPHPCPNCRDTVAAGSRDVLCLECVGVKAAHAWPGDDGDYPGDGDA